MGRRVPRREDPALLSDAGKYTSDIHLPGALHMVVVLTPYTYGTIRHVDTNAARALDGLVAVLIAPDVNPHVAHPFPNMRMLDRYSVRRAPQRYPLAAVRVRHVGDPVAIILAHNRYVAADAQLSSIDPQMLDSDLRRLSQMLQDHLAHEETRVCPLLARLPRWLCCINGEHFPCVTCSVLLAYWFR